MLSFGYLHEDTVIQILKVKICTNCIFEEQTYYKIAILTKNTFLDVPIYIIDIAGIGEKIGIKGMKGEIIFDPKAFKHLQ